MSGGPTVWAAKRHGQLGILAIVTACAILLLPTVAQGVSPRPLATWTVYAPYHGSSQSTSSTVWTGCAKGHVGSFDRFSLRSGIGGFSGSAKARSCSVNAGNSGGVSTGSSEGVSHLWINLPGLRGTHTVTVNWTFAVYATQTIRFGTCSGSVTANTCYRYAGWSVTGYPELYDRTNGTTLSFGTAWPGISNESYFDSWCYEAQCSSEISGGNGTQNFTGTVSVSWILNLTGAKGTHLYALELVLDSIAYAGCSAWGVVLKGCVGSALLDMSTPNYGAKLDSVSIS
ncbi:MAG: hypothetical protein L3K09_02125 [Thermoplasmata archaeon]|nr:hypothetical protein [Thermoplasmata archaeon]